MIKAFISHSSKQKENFVKPLVELLGRDSCVIDSYDFQAAYKSLDEIYRQMDRCSIFVFLVSKDSLESDWCKKELAHAYEKLSNSQLLRFWPFIIDEDVKIEDTPEWIHKTKCYNLKLFKTPRALAREIEQKIREIIWNENPAIRNYETIFVGRNSELDDFETKYYSGQTSRLRAAIISGRDGVGKEAFAIQCLQKIGKNIETIPFKIDLSPKEGVEDFIINLNLITGTFTQDVISDKILTASVKDKSHYAVMLLNDLYSLSTVLFLHDDLCVVLPNRKLPEWFIDVITSPDLNAQMGMFIQSRLTPLTTTEANLPQLITITLNPLNKSDRKKLFYMLLNLYGMTDVNESDVDEIVDKLNQSPLQLIKFVHALKSQDINLVKKDLPYYIELGDNKLKPLFDLFQEGEEKELLIVLSKFNFVSFRMLERIYKDNIHETQKTISKLLASGLASTFGPSGCFIKLDYALADYIRRNHIELPKDLEQWINDVLEGYLMDDIDMDTDLSVYLINAKTRIITGRATNRDYLIPSVVVKTIVELYNSRDYTQVIKMCKFVLNEFTNYDSEVTREIRFWFCLALCREQKKDDFYKEVNTFNGADYYFLRGFYFRLEGNPDKAQNFYEEAMKLSPNMQKAKREYVASLLEQRKYDEALDKSKDNFESSPENTYHIHAYFRCLIKKRVLTNDEIHTLEHLIDLVNNSHSPKKMELFKAMTLEYDSILAKKTVDELLEEMFDAEKLFPKSIDVRRVVSEFKFKQGIIHSRQSFREDC